MTNFQKSTRLHILANYIGQGWSGLMAIVFLPVYIRFLGLEGYGLVGVLMFMQTWFTLLDFGITPTINREMARFSAGERGAQNTRDLFRTIEWIVGGIGMAIAVAVWLSSQWIASDWLKLRTLDVSEVARAITLIGALVALRFVEGIYRGAMLGLHQHVWLNAATTLLSTLRWGGAALLLAVWAPSLVLFFGWQMLVSAATIASFGWKINSELPGGAAPGRFSKREIASVWRFAGGSMLATSLAVLLTQLDKLMLSRLSTLETFGYYTAAWTVAAGLYQLIIPITQVYFPKFTSLAASPKSSDLGEAFHQAAQFLTWVLLPPASMLIFFSGAILQHWTRDPVLTTTATPLVSLFALGVILNGFLYIPHIFALSTGWTRFGVGMNGLSLLVFSPILAASIHYHGAIGAASVWAAIHAVGFLIGMQFFFRHLLRKEKWRWYLWDIGLPVAVASAVSLLFRWVFKDTTISVIQLFLIYAVTVFGVSMVVPRIRQFALDLIVGFKTHA
ncbi:hypothetical protein RD110_07070 [Rhodoferax koreense]|uniref:Polysaccharide biosynthesis protein n=1 Tax=Rhodoferax koreensis TaxID=1842727 RepID=A0A1P8JTC6_9BURK|nr:oligosaccharide flippase family protein [Rhodoferax koreense]APW36990.1 hypothetical protein RD110_07070 [Rhodoferax koreense]